MLTVAATVFSITLAVQRDPAAVAADVAALAGVGHAVLGLRARAETARAQPVDRRLHLAHHAFHEHLRAPLHQAQPFVVKSVIRVVSVITTP